ncbi:ribonuclease P protein subunit p40 isoform X1 [Phocoena sinus]|uniref:Ribonuclease P/MRP subunit p40 n=2 Tax=Phocoena sinus TaxID=42100 RepID=A0A8C9C787_PHOSS|nr:ribonuclease P protein subunit p40 isoform X1 [Phocoena sinus]XP_032504965.1 ribonuclease P protein subunit p40 isoform X1 [Phocoena sinus]XP_032504966.1 ribonuclease P protein subunit p40 isoform X1 [Phocoena sinus]XP_032504967.1 ribonuclease P protein subunit p40 isoform X1 [Phocoena sinus]XP_032504968.1 ribonuclease P protein subunit p40 isoform X1 [Phocoena sinus]
MPAGKGRGEPNAGRTCVRKTMAMLCRLREVPRHLLVCEKSNFSHEKSRHRHLVETHYHNYRVSFLIPECGILSKELKDLVMDSGPYYLVKDLPLHELIAHEFISTFVKKGACYALTYNTNIDEDNTVALLPNGKLILSLDKDTYEETGLQGRPSQYSGRKTMKFIVSIDLMDLSSKLDSKKYKRVSWAFKEKKPLKFDFLLAWHQTGAEGSTMMSYFSNYRIQERQPKIALSTVTDLPCPVLRSGELRGEPEAACSAQELFEWLGAVFSNAELNNEPDNFISTYCCPQPSTVVAKAYLCTITGFILPEKIHLLLEQLCRYFDEPKLAPWVTLSVQGFADSPVSWRENEHGFRKGGEHLYNFVVFSNRDYWLQLAVGADDDCPP